jgi:hypothetical protein
MIFAVEIISQPVFLKNSEEIFYLEVEVRKL